MLPILATTGTEIITSITALSTETSTQNGNQAWAQALIAGLEKLGNAIKSFFTPPTNPFNENFVNIVNSEYGALKNAVSSYVPIKIENYDYASILYGTKINEIIASIEKYNLINETLITELNALSTYERDGNLLKAYRIGYPDGSGTYFFIGWAGGYQTSDWEKYVKPMLTHLMNIGIIDKVANVNDPNNELSFGADISPTTKIIDVSNLLNIIETIKSSLNDIQNTITKLNNEALQEISTIVSTDLPTRPSNPFDIPLPTIPRSRQQEPETIHPDIVRDFGIADEIYAWWVEHMNRLAELTKTQTAAITRTITITATEKEPSKGRGGNNWWRKTQDKRKSIERIKADVSLRSEWIKWVIFTFPKKEDFNSNAKGKLTFVLKNGNSYDIGTYSRGTFSYIAVLMMGTGYGWWSAIPKNKRRLSDPETISYNMPNISTQIRIKSIAKELTTDGIYYW